MGIRPVKNGDGGGGDWLVRMEWRPDGWSVSASVNLLLDPEVVFWHRLTQVVPEKGL